VLQEELNKKQAEKKELAEKLEAAKQRLVQKKQEALLKEEESARAAEAARRVIVEQKLAELREELNKKEAQNKELAEKLEAVTKRLAQQKEEIRQSKEKKRQERIIANKGITPQRGDKSPVDTAIKVSEAKKPIKDKEENEQPRAVAQKHEDQIKVASMPDQEQPPETESLRDKEAAFMAEQKEKQRKLKEEERKRIQLERAEAIALKEKKRQEHLKEQQAKKEEELRIVRESQPASSKPATQPKPEKLSRQPIRKTIEEPPASKPPPLPPAVVKETPMSDMGAEKTPTLEERRQRQSNELKDYASEIKRQLIEEESSKIRSNGVYEQEYDQKRGPHAGSTVYRDDGIRQKQMIEDSFYEDAPREVKEKPRRKSDRNREIKNRLDQIDAWLEENLW